MNSLDFQTRELLRGFLGKFTWSKHQLDRFMSEIGNIDNKALMLAIKNYDAGFDKPLAYVAKVLLNYKAHLKEERKRHGTNPPERIVYDNDGSGKESNE